MRLYFALVMLVLTLFGCSKVEQKKVELPSQPEDVLKRIQDTKELCNSMKKQLEAMDRNIKSTRIEPMDPIKKNQPYKDLLDASTNYIKACGVFDSK